jgi:hypothetical protein
MSMTMGVVTSTKYMPIFFIAPRRDMIHMAGGKG